jgi:hypothetical protein
MLVLLGARNNAVAGAGWWCTQAMGPVNGYTTSMCYRTVDDCEKVRSFNSNIELTDCRYQKKAVAFSFFNKLTDRTEQRAACTTVSCHGNRAFLLRSEQRHDISHVTQCSVVE